MLCSCKPGLGKERSRSLAARSWWGLTTRSRCGSIPPTMTDAQHPGDQHVADHEAGHLAVFDVLRDAASPLGFRIIFEWLDVSIDGVGEERGFHDIECKQNLPTALFVEALKVQTVAGAVSDAYGTHLGSSGERERGLSAERFISDLPVLLQLAEALMIKSGGLDLDAFKKEFPKEAWDWRELLKKALVYVAADWQRIYWISAVLMNRRAILLPCYEDIKARGDWFEADGSKMRGIFHVLTNDIRKGLELNPTTSGSPGCNSAATGTPI